MYFIHLSTPLVPLRVEKNNREFTIILLYPSKIFVIVSLDYERDRAVKMTKT